MSDDAVRISTREYLNLLLNLSVESSRIQMIRVQQDRGVYRMRPQIHLIIAGEQCSFKSSAIEKVAEVYDTTPYMGITVPAMVGTIDSDTREIMPGAAWDQRNKVLAIDEFNFTDRAGRPDPVIEPMLSLCENEQRYQRKVGIRNKTHEEYDDYDPSLYFKVDRGTIEVKSNFTLMIGTMDKLNFMNHKLKALKSRCIPIKWYPDWDVIMGVLRGDPLYWNLGLMKKTKKVVDVPNEEYERIIQYMGNNVPRDIFARVLGDCVRAYAIIGEHRTDVYELIKMLKRSR